jgi:hypothetical protein
MLFPDHDFSKDATQQAAAAPDDADAASPRADTVLAATKSDMPHEVGRARAAMACEATSGAATSAPSMVKVDGVTEHAPSSATTAALAAAVVDAVSVRFSATETRMDELSSRHASHPHAAARPPHTPRPCVPRTRRRPRAPRLLLLTHTPPAPSHITR